MSTTTIYANKGARIAKNGSLSEGAGASDYLPTGLYSGYTFRALLGFSYSFTGWTSITAATLHLRTSSQHYVAFGSDPDIHVSRIGENWSQGSGEALSTGNAVTWSNQPSIGSDPNSAELDVSTSEDTWVSVDITAMMQNALAAGVFYGLLIRAVDEGTGTDVTEFYSDDTTSKPYIDITYATNNPPNAPTGLSPTGDTIVNTLTPTLAGTFSDPDAGDTMSGVEVEVWTDDLATKMWGSGMLGAIHSTFSVTYAGSSLTGNHFYKWRGRNKDNSGAVGAWSSYQRFKANSVPYAASVSIAGVNSDELTLTPSFTFTHNDPDAENTTAAAYHAILTRTSDGATIWDSGDVTLGSPATSTTITYAGAALSWQTQYSLKARTKDTNGAWGPYSSGTTFSTHTTGTPTSLSPAVSAVASSLTPTFVGSRGNSNDSLASASIEVYATDGVTLIWSTGTFTSGVTTSGFSKVYAGTALTAATTYKWRARVTGAIGGTSTWTSLQTFITPDTNTPTITAPIGTGVTSLTPSLAFNRSASFNRHQLTVYDTDGTTVLFSDTPVSYTATTSKSVTYAGTALTFGKTYFWKVRVSSDGGTTWSPYAGPVSFMTDTAGLPALTAPINDSWQTTLTPTFTGTTSGGETISTFRVKVYASNGTTLIWDSGNLAGSSTSFSKVYAGSALAKGSSYKWTASYVKTGGAIGSDAPLAAFHINADPQAPTSLSPVSGSVVQTLSPTFTGTFNDTDIAAWGDTPTVLTVEVYRTSDSALMHTLTKSTGLVVGANGVSRVAEGTALTYGVQYQYRMKYTDSKSAVGAWSSYTLFRPANAPGVTVTAPGSTVSSPSFTTTWSFSSSDGKSQAAYQVSISRDADLVVVYDSGRVASSASSFVVPGGFLTNGTAYTVTVTVWDTDNLFAVDTQSFSSSWTAPAAPANFSVATDPATSTVTLSWDQSTLIDADFSFYQVYRRKLGETDFTAYATLVNKTDIAFTDQFAANNTTYDYMVTQFKRVPGDVDLESADDDLASAVLDADYWFAVGADGAAAHSIELPVTNESHVIPLQQEIFEPLGSKRKKVARGNALGNEGSLDVLWPDEEREAAQVFLAYISENAGPHILKSPFGDVWSVEFAGPVKKYAPGGAISVSLSWIEVA